LEKSRQGNYGLAGFPVRSGVPSGLGETKTEFGLMITLEDCLAFCGLTKEEVLANAKLTARNRFSLAA
jgi:hypothetical protein